MRAPRWICCAAVVPACNLSTKSKRSSAYASRGGQKLRGALDAFALDPRGLVCLDVGSSTGGFTDCLIKAGAQSVTCIDVGYGLLDWSLRKNPKVRVLERTNFRHFDASSLSPKADLATLDLSFISVLKILSQLHDCLAPGGQAILLIKPQFEGTAKEVPGGFVRDEATRQLILARVRAEIVTQAFQIRAEADSCIKGRKGNQETFFHLIPSGTITP